jgi:hypothetical protein
MASGRPLCCGERTLKATFQQRGASQLLPLAELRNQSRNLLITTCTSPKVVCVGWNSCYLFGRSRTHVSSLTEEFYFSQYSLADSVIVPEIRPGRLLPDFQLFVHRA